MMEMTHTLKNNSILPSTSSSSSLITPPNSPPTTDNHTKLPSHPRSILTQPTSPNRILLVPDVSYLETLDLRLKETISKALSHSPGPSLPSELVDGKRPIPTGRGRSLGILIASELQAARDNKHLYRAILRILHKRLSVLLSNLSALLLPLLSSPAFLRPVPSPQSPTSNPIQLHALAIADFAGELLSSFDDMALGMDTENRGDGLKSVRSGLVSVIGRVVTPLVTGIKEELIPLIDTLETPVETTFHKGRISVHPSITKLQSCVPIYGRALARYASAYPTHPSLASFLIFIVWRALVALSHRPVISPSPAQTHAEKGQRIPSSRILSVAYPTGLFNLGRSSLRPASLVIASTSAHDAKALYEILSRLPRPTHTQVAREAVDEAFVHFKALVSLLEVVDSSFFGVNRTVEEIADEIHPLTDELPTLIALPVLMRMYYFTSANGPQVGTIAELLDVSEDTYRRDYLAGFGRAEQCGPVIVQRLLDKMYARPVAGPSERFVDWLEARLG